MIKFGTSGFRGIIADNFTKENVCKIAYAVAKIINDDANCAKVVTFGYDNRFLGEYFAKWATEVLVANGIKVVFYDHSVPCTLIAHMVKSEGVGLYITASHNPYYYSGIKVFVQRGREPQKEFTDKLTKIANKVNYDKIKIVAFDTAVNNGMVTLTRDITNYCDFMVKNIGSKNIKNSDVKVLFNAMHGATVDCAKYCFKKLGLKNYTILNENPDPYFGGGMPAPYKHNLTEQLALMKKCKYDFGFALDGDGDRVSFIDKTGEIYDCNYIAVVLYYYMVKYKGYKGGFVHNIAFTSLLDKVVADMGYKTYQSLVGFKNVAQKIIDTDAFIGAETNGIAFANHILHKDGLYTAFLLIDCIAAIGKPLSEIIATLKRSYCYPSEAIEYAYETTQQYRDQLHRMIYDKKVLPKLSRPIESVDYSDGLKINFAHGYWTMVRFSGTECVMRIFAEMENLAESEAMVKEMEQYIGLSVRQ